MTKPEPETRRIDYIFNILYLLTYLCPVPIKHFTHHFVFKLHWQSGGKRWFLSLSLSCVFCLQSTVYRTGVLYKCLNWQLSQEITTKLFVESYIILLKESWTVLNVEPSRLLNSVFEEKKLCCIVLIYLEMEDSFNFFVILCSVSSFYFDINQFRLFRCKVEHNVSSKWQCSMLKISQYCGEIDKICQFMD